MRTQRQINSDTFAHLVSITLFILALAFAVSLFTGCVNAKRCAKFIQPVQADTIIRDSIVERVRDTVIFIEGDSSVLTALLECKGDKVRLVEILHYTTGKLSKTPEIKVINNVAYIKCRVDSLQVYFHWREKNVFRSIKTAAVYVKISNILTGWQWFQVWMGRIFAGIILLIVIWAIIKKYIPFLK